TYRNLGGPDCRGRRDGRAKFPSQYWCYVNFGPLDYPARVQTVHKETNRQYYNLLKCFEELTGYGVMVNTSFNVRGDPIVCAPEDAYRCFMRTEIDLLVLGKSISLQGQSETAGSRRGLEERICYRLVHIALLRENSCVRLVLFWPAVFS